MKIKNIYFTGYLPFISILLFSLSLSVYFQSFLLGIFKKIGLYNGMLEFFTETEMKLTMILGLMLVFFMIFSALKLVADTINQLSFLFFSKDTEGEIIKAARMGTLIYFVGSLISLLSIASAIGIAIIFVLTTLSYFAYFVYKTSSSFTTPGLIGIICFEIIVWVLLIVLIIFIVAKIYNSLMSGLPV
ncbi:hypothetical protein J2S13_003010 [Oikeobacillus pervagus]|uniref:YufK family protein n=1 Tax=Oikeobacillus pervagus TaxID=1325931 RepID=A0AAJ1T0Y4_9BACI|nr:DUF5366 family protein [Oikeobacillus pervagus]MDQ0216548.1 hypothetical protein [Oikeobacillus pervagus]